jgi:hypothetical protein
MITLAVLAGSSLLAMREEGAWVVRESVRHVISSLVERSLGSLHLDLHQMGEICNVRHYLI